MTDSIPHQGPPFEHKEARQQAGWHCDDRHDHEGAVHKRKLEREKQFIHHHDTNAAAARRRAAM